MYFDSLSGLAAMGGHGIYVWSSYGIGLAVIAYNIIAPLIARRAVLERIFRLHRLALKNEKTVAGDLEGSANGAHGGSG